MQYRSKSLADTERLGKALAQSLLKSALPCISLFQGPFGSGKTTLIKVLISEIASIRQESIASPTFQYVTLYQGKKNLSIAHFDLWRLPSPESFYALGLEDIVDSSLSFIEWPEKLGSLCPEASLIIRINAPQEEERMFEIEDRRHLLDTCSLEFS